MAPIPLIPPLKRCVEMSKRINRIDSKVTNECEAREVGFLSENWTYGDDFGNLIYGTAVVYDMWMIY